MRVLLWSALLVCTLCARGLNIGVAIVVPSEGESAHGLLVGSRSPPDAPALGTWLEQRRVALVAKPIRLVVGLDVYEITLGEVGVEVDVAATMGSC